jgi:DNA invertase Pin-like site-specific DNA recombinase
VVTFAKSAGYEIVEEFYDAALSADAIDERPGFAAMLQRLLGNGVRTIIVETASRFARDLIVQETGWRFLRNAGVTLVAADSPDSFLDETPTAVLVRQVLGAVAQFEKQALVAKLRKARERKKAATGKCGGRHSVAQAKPATVALAKKLAGFPINRHRRSLREIAAELKAAGHVTSKGTPYGAAAIARMIA